MPSAARPKFMKMISMAISEQPGPAILEHLPSAAAPWSDLEAFCQLIAGPRGDPRSIDELAQIARCVEVDMPAASAGDLLTAAYFFWRKFRWNEGLDVEAERSLRLVIGALERRRAREGPAGAQDAEPFAL